MKRSPELDQFFNALLNLKTLDEYYLFFDDICTIKEINDFSQRLEVARLLDLGETYGTVTEATGVSSATIGRVNRCLQYGGGGYKLALERMKK